MSRAVFIVCALIGFVAADDGYAAPQASGYGAPAPAVTGYGAPDAAYGAPETGYGPPATGYGAPAPITEGGGDLIDLGKLEELAPLFLAVFAAIILANILGPLVGALFGLKAGLVAPILGPIGSAKGSLVNIILGIFGLQLCDLTGAAFPAAKKRSFEDGAPSEVNSEVMELLMGKVGEAIQKYSS